MKNVWILALLTCCSFQLQAQNNLQFNRVVLLNADSTTDCSSGICPDTFLLRRFVVPAGKVLKIESINFQVPSSYYRLFFNQTPFSSTSTNVTNTFPIWLPAGEYKLYFFYKVNSSAYLIGRFSYLMSALEFNVVQ